MSSPSRGPARSWAKSWRSTKSLRMTSARRRGRARPRRCEDAAAPRAARALLACQPPVFCAPAITRAGGGRGVIIVEQQRAPAAALQPRSAAGLRCTGASTRDPKPAWRCSSRTAIEPPPPSPTRCGRIRKQPRDQQRHAAGGWSLFSPQPVPATFRSLPHQTTESIWFAPSPLFVPQTGGTPVHWAARLGKADCLERILRDTVHLSVVDARDNVRRFSRGGRKQHRLPHACARRIAVAPVPFFPPAAAAPSAADGPLLPVRAVSP